MPARGNVLGYQAEPSGGTKRTRMPNGGYRRPHPLSHVYGNRPARHILLQVLRTVTEQKDPVRVRRASRRCCSMTASSPSQCQPGIDPNAYAAPPLSTPRAPSPLPLSAGIDPADGGHGRVFFHQGGGARWQQLEGRHVAAAYALLNVGVGGRGAALQPTPQQVRVGQKLPVTAAERHQGLLRIPRRRGPRARLAIVSAAAAVNASRTRWCTMRSRF